MSDSIQDLIQQYHVYYEVSPYYVVVEQEHGSGSNKIKKRIQSGFDVEVHGVSNKSQLELPPPEYAFAYAELKKIADTVSRTNTCFIEIISSPSTFFLQAGKHFRPEAIVRIRISHVGDLDQPVGVSEQHALEEIEKQLQVLGIMRR